MVPIDTYKTYWEQVATLVGIERTEIVSDETELQFIIRDIADQSMILAAVIPSGDSEAPDADNIEEVDKCFIFVLMKINPADFTRLELHNIRALTQAKLVMIKEQMHADHVNVTTNTVRSLMMRRLVIDKMHSDPEYNYLGCTGWSLSFQLKSKWYDHE